MSHDHGPPVGKQNKRRLLFVLGLTSLYLIAEVIGGIWTKSLALIADAGHMLTDVAGLLLALLALWFAERKATPKRTYGYYRVEILAALTNAVILIGISLYVLYEAYQRFRHPPVVASQGMLAVASIGLVINIIGVLVLRKGSSNSLNLKGAYFEVLSDMITSVGVIVAALIIWLTGWSYADPLISAGIGLFIFPRTWILLRDTVHILLEGTPAGIDLAQVRESLSQLPGVTGLHDLHIWSLTSNVHAMSVHVLHQAEVSTHALLQEIQKKMKTDFHISHLTVQLEQKTCEFDEIHF